MLRIRGAQIHGMTQDGVSRSAAGRVWCASKPPWVAPAATDAILEDIRYRRLDPDWGGAESFALAKLSKDSRPSRSDPDMYVR